MGKISSHYLDKDFEQMLEELNVYQKNQSKKKSTT